MRIFSTKKDNEQGQPAAAPVEPIEKPVIANQSAFLVWQSPNFSGPKLIGSALKLGDSHASVRYFLGMTLTFLTHCNAVSPFGLTAFFVKTAAGGFRRR